MANCKCNAPTDGNRAIISLCPTCAHVKGYVLPPDWLSRITNLPIRLPGETNEHWKWKVATHTGGVVRVIRLYDQWSKMKGKGGRGGSTTAPVSG
jgi:hypothetical protein